MPKLNTLVQVGFCTGYGDGDYRVSAAVQSLSRERMRELKAALIDAAVCMDDMWKRGQPDVAHMSKAKAGRVE